MKIPHLAEAIKTLTEDSSFMSQYQMAKCLDISQSMVGKILRGNAGVDFVAKICREVEIKFIKWGLAQHTAHHLAGAIRMAAVKDFMLLTGVQTVPEQAQVFPFGTLPPGTQEMLWRWGDKAMRDPKLFNLLKSMTEVLGP